MKLLPLRANRRRTAEQHIPVTVYTVGTELQPPTTRLNGFSADQLFITFSGTGVFKRRGQDQWDIIEPDSFFYIPAGVPHEYLPQGEEPWFIGYVSFDEHRPGLLESFGFGGEPFHQAVKHTGRLYELLEQIWAQAGPDSEGWRSAELFLSFCLELNKQTVPRGAGSMQATARPVRYPDSLVESVVLFLHDFLQRDVTMAELSSHFGYSSKQLSRLFQQKHGTTPLQYLQRLRLQTAAQMLAENPSMTVRQAAAHIGMEPVYFARLFRRSFGIVPSEHQARFK
ncbi:helix-turn-helix domain-containing protein [Paenibacillus thermotolerans]|uniref:helix-turn-helix domain-containing protein n=1 Tax=Paenibacillus thermotolerans TaxID=3027807 RepID=UPI002368A02E|nr:MULTISPECIES: AraC family transcriptional regulator [unclassified Paenibacillus]